MEYPSGETKIPGNKGDATGSEGDATGSTSGVRSSRTFDDKSGSSGNQGFSDGVSVNVSAVSKSGSSGNGGAKPPADDSTPDPESGEMPVYYDPKRDPGRGQPLTQGEKEAEKRLADLMPDFEDPEDRFNLFDSLTQPVGPEDSVTDAGPPPDLSEELGSGLDPLINWGDDKDEGDEEFVGSQPDVDITPVDPPDMAGGGEGIEDTDGTSKGFEDIDP